MMSLESEIARVVLQWFDNSISQCQKKIPASEWTVLAGIVLQTRCAPSSTIEAASTDTIRLLTAATGNKCIGRRDLNADGFVVNDCHAEVLARRAFLRYLYIEALLWQKNRLESCNRSIFERHPSSGRLMLKPQHSLHLFVSEAPCGDAAIYELREDVVDQLVQQRAVGSPSKINEARDHEMPRSELRITGAKRSKDYYVENSQDQIQPDKRFAQTVGIGRVKSGRSDLPQDKQTLSMSCSDKLAKWVVLGLQGSLLLQWFEPIHLASIVVSEDDRAKSLTEQEQALRRAVCTRLGQHDALLKEKDFPSCIAHVVSTIPLFSHRRTSNRAPSSLALNWTVRESSWARSDEQQTSTPIVMNRMNFTEQFFHSFELEFLVAATGFKQGAKKASKMNQIAMEKAASRLSKRNLLRAFYHVLGQNSLQDTVCGLDYLQLKQAVPLNVSSTIAASVSSESTTCVAYKFHRKQFFAALSEWVGVPDTFKQFKL